MIVLGISAFYHDSASALIKNGEIIAAAHEERFTRKKHDANFPLNAIKYCLEEANVTLDDLSAIVFYEKPFLKFERLLETYYAFAPKGLKSFLASMPLWIKEKLFIKKIIRDELFKISPFNKEKLKLLFSEHHLSHAASAFYPSPFEEAAIVTIDGVGEWATASICYGKDKELQILKELRFPHSVGLLYSAFTYYLGFKVNSGEYKLMGLAPYGIPHSIRVKEFIKKIKSEIVHVYEDGSVWLNQQYFNYTTGLTMTNDDMWFKLLNIKRRLPETPINQSHCDLAYAIQKITEEIILKMVTHAKTLTKSKNLCLAGGVALNCVANSEILKSGLYDNIFIQPAAGDAGGALGAALAAYHIYFNQERIITKPDAIKGAFLGPNVHENQIKKMIEKYHARYTKFENEKELCNKVAQLIDQGYVIGWVQGRMEFGPRALGARSILADARKPEMQKKVNLKVKFRESFRPFAPSVLAEDCNKYFETVTCSPYMLYTTPIKSTLRTALPDNYFNMPLEEKLNFVRSTLPAITHVDFSARIQTVHKETNTIFYELLQAFKTLTSYGVVLNTSFNRRGEPIVCTPEEAYICFMNTDIDYLVIENYLFDKKEQPHITFELSKQELLAED